MATKQVNKAPVKAAPKKAATKSAPIKKSKALTDEEMHEEARKWWLDRTPNEEIIIPSKKELSDLISIEAAKQNNAALEMYRAIDAGVVAPHGVDEITNAVVKTISECFDGKEQNAVIANVISKTIARREKMHEGMKEHWQSLNQSILAVNKNINDVVTSIKPLQDAKKLFA